MLREKDEIDGYFRVVNAPGPGSGLGTRRECYALRCQRDVAIGYTTNLDFFFKGYILFLALKKSLRILSPANLYISLTAHGHPNPMPHRRINQSLQSVTLSI